MSKEMNISEHLEDLRKVLIKSLWGIFIMTAISYAFFIEDLMAIVVGPLENIGEDLFFLSVTEGFFTHIKVAFFFGLLFASPFLIWQILKFIWPALYKEEKKLFLPLVLTGILLFLAGIFFAYSFVLEIGLKILIIDFSGDLTPMLSVNKYVSFVLAFLLPFGLIFEIPLITFFLTKMGILNPKFMREKRRYVIFVMFVLAAVLSPGPDVVGQLFLALPMLVLYEISIFISWLLSRKKKS